MTTSDTIGNELKKHMNTLAQQNFDAVGTRVFWVRESMIILFRQQ